jgi:hypothetical protein
MCQKGVNSDQLGMMIAYADDTLALAQKWLEEIHHLSDHAEMTDPSAEVAQSSVLVGEARARLARAMDEIEGQTGGPDASVELV